MPQLRLFFAISILMGLYAISGCNNKSAKDQNSKTTELDTISFKNLSQKAYDYLNKQQDSCESVYKISSYEHWFYDQETGKLTFSDKGVNKLIIDYETVGSVSEVTNTFLWSWENSTVEEKVKSDMYKVKEFGEKRHFIKLIIPKITADLYDGWEMTAISSYILHSKGAYRVPTDSGNLYLFMIFKNIRWADTSTVKHKITYSISPISHDKNISAHNSIDNIRM